MERDIYKGKCIPQYEVSNILDWIVIYFSKMMIRFVGWKTRFVFVT